MFFYMTIVSYFDDLNNEFSNKYEKKLKIEKPYRVYFSSYILIVIQTYYNFIII
jgi:hypothetical protein